MSSLERQYVCFEVDGCLYGLDIRVVKEVNAHTEITPVPLSQKHVAGLVNIRGQVVLVIDIAAFFGHDPLKATSQSHIIVLKTVQDMQRLRDADGELDFKGTGDKAVGCLVDRIAEVVVADASDLAPTPSHISPAVALHVEGVIRLKNRLLVILNPKGIFCAS